MSENNSNGIEMLPLPEPFDEHRTRDSVTVLFTDEQLDAHALAVAEHNVAAKDAEIEALKERDEKRGIYIREQWEEIEALRAEVERLSQLVNGCKGPLPAGAVAWLDMGLQEASLMFDKKTDSSRASKRRGRELFQRVSSGHYPLYLEPQADRAERLADALDAVWRVMPADARYLDPPDGGDVPLHEQVRRMAADAARTERLAEALRGMLLDAPGGHSCEEFHHHKSDRHMPGDDCPAQFRWLKAVTTAQAALRDHDQEGKDG